MWSESEQIICVFVSTNKWIIFRNIRGRKGGEIHYQLGEKEKEKHEKKTNANIKCFCIRKLML